MLSKTGVLLWQGYILLFVRVQFYVPSFLGDFFVNAKIVAFPFLINETEILTTLLSFHPTP